MDAIADPSPRRGPRAWATWLWAVACGRRGRWWAALVWAVAALLLLRLALPPIATAMANRYLGRPGRYQGHVDGISLHLWRGAYAVHRLALTVQREDGGPRTPLLDVDRIDIGLLWRELFHGRFVGSIGLQRPVLRVVPAPTVGTEKPKGERSVAIPPPPGPGTPAERWQDKVQGLATVRLERIIIADGRLSYEDREHGFATEVGDIAAAIEGLAVGHGSRQARTRLRLDGRSIGDGLIHLDGEAEPLAERPTFRLRTSLEHLHLTALNPATARVGGLVFAAGTFDAYVEAEARDGRIDGYTKVLFHDLDVASFRQESGGAATRLFWKIAVPVGEWILRNVPKDQHAARIPFGGPIDDPHADVWALVGSSLRNAFLDPLLPGWDGGR